MTKSKKYKLGDSLKPDICALLVDYAMMYEKAGMTGGAIFLPGHFFGAIVEDSATPGSPFIPAGSGWYKCGILDLYHAHGIQGDKIFAAGTDEREPDADMEFA